MKNLEVGRKERVKMIRNKEKMVLAVKMERERKNKQKKKNKLQNFWS